VTALRAIKTSLIDPNKNLNNWDQGDPCTSNWTGVVCHNATFSDDGYLHVDRLYDFKLSLASNLLATSILILLEKITNTS
jgi:hypothetical protein